ncbi:purine permease 1-like isoform X1 [Iris pallida]|uniref:Purine permease 1-like isoform X1 n=1 Tax=Iris pallida TaxID=29817 RepID=A0AAX6FEP7_IRIPA|nr:purine permease 1-like isoform X1 [Iris pallida]
MFGAVVLGIHSSGDRPEGESRGQYYAGFVMTGLGRGALRAAAAAGGAHLREGQAEDHPRWFMEMAARHGLLCYSFLYCGDAGQQRFPGDTERGEVVRARRDNLLPLARLLRHHVAVLLPGDDRRYILRLCAARRGPHGRSHPGNGGPSRRLLPRIL